MVWCQRALTRKGCGGALEAGDRRLLEDGSERGNALNSDVVAFETASEGCDGDGEREACQRALTQKQTLGAAAHSSEITALPLSPSQSLVMPSVVYLPKKLEISEAPQSPLSAKLPREGGTVSMGADTKANTQGAVWRTRGRRSSSL